MLGKDLKSKLLRWFIAGILSGVTLMVLYTWGVLNWNYSSGERAGFVQKLSKKGWLCKTWEGELAMINVPGTLTEKFFFTVKSDEVAQAINDSMGKRVSLEYEEHVGVPSQCFGETMYYVSKVRVVE